MNGKPAEGICRINSEYPRDNFWWDSQLRITPPFQGGIHYLEPFTHALAELDACRITRGGLFVDTGHAALMQGFAKAYRTLPAEKFETIGGSTDPVAVRTLVSGEKRYLYLVNREYYPVKVRLKLGKNTNQITDLVTNRTIKTSAGYDITLNPYELCSLGMDSKAVIEGFSATPPEKIVAQLKRIFNEATANVGLLDMNKIELPIGTAKLLSEIRVGIEEKRYAWVRRALDSYPIRKCEELAHPAKVIKGSN